MRFMERPWHWLWLEFWVNEQILYYSDRDNCRKVDSNYKWWRAPVKCKIVSVSWANVEVWDWYINTYANDKYHKRSDLYYIKTSERWCVQHHKYWISVDTESIDILDEVVYKVTRIE